MSFKFKVGDRVRVTNFPTVLAEIVGGDPNGKEGEVTKLGGCATPDEGAVVTNEDFPSGDALYGEHGIWLPDSCLELIQ